MSVKRSMDININRSVWYNQLFAEMLNSGYCIVVAAFFVFYIYKFINLFIHQSI